jgi:mono/diheme cytochrome c family protein
MMSFHTQAAPMALALLLGVAVAACGPAREKAGPAPVDSGVQTGSADTTVAGDTAAQEERGDTVVVPSQPDTVVLPPDTGGVGPDTSIATPPINPAPSTTGRDTPPQGGAPPPTGDQSAQGKGAKLSQLEYEGWRQYNVNCARCHGQDALPNPVAANLLVSMAPGGPMDSAEKFAQVVTEGRSAKGMPAFKGVLNPEQTQAIYAYLKGRAEKRIPPGRPERPGA